MKIAIVSGGTGGHIYPAMTLAEELEKRGHSVSFFGSNDRMEKDLIPESGFEYIGLDVYTTRGGIGQKLKSVVSIAKAYRQCCSMLKGYDMAIGFGNYISIPVMLGASHLGLKTIIHEQNSFVGRANRVLDTKMDMVIGSYEENLKQFRNKNTFILGNPQVHKALNVKKDPQVIRDLGLDPDKKTVLIFMGSLGSASVNEKLLEYFALADGSYQIVYATGHYNYETVKKSAPDRDFIRYFGRVEGAKVMKNADLLVSRAGATTLAEICAIGVPSILIPSPFVPNNHQFYNGKALVDKDAAEMIEEKDLDAVMLDKKINELIHDDKRLEVMSNNARKLANRNVLNDIIEKVESL